jgi:hypothetical protein
MCVTEFFTDQIFMAAEQSSPFHLPPTCCAGVGGVLGSFYPIAMALAMVLQQ